MSRPYTTVAMTLSYAVRPDDAALVVRTRCRHLILWNRHNTKRKTVYDNRSLYHTNQVMLEMYQRYLLDRTAPHGSAT